jgi:hypothetical protein
VDQARRLKEPEQEKAKLNRLVPELSLEKPGVEGHRRGKLLTLNGGGVPLDHALEQGMSERWVWPVGEPATSATCTSLLQRECGGTVGRTVSARCCASRSCR